MTEAAAAFNEIQKERSSLKNASHHRKGGSANSKLGNRRMTNKEIQEKHGECKTYDCGDLTMTFAQFREMPNDLQVEFLNKLQDKYDISVKHIGRELFELTNDDTLRSHLQLRKIWDLCNPNKARAKTGLLQFRDDIAEARKRAELAKIIDVHSAVPDPESIPKFMTWAEFKALSGEEKVIFINRLLDEYQVGLVTIDHELFGFKYPTSRTLLVRSDIYDGIHSEIGRLPSTKSKMYKELVKRFHDDISEWRGENSTITEETQKESKPEVVETVEAIEDPVQQAVDDPYDNNYTLIDYSPLIKQAIKDPMEYHDSSFASSYIRNGLDLDEFHALALLFDGKKVKVEISITEL